jgi:hypothetical protein
MADTADRANEVEGMSTDREVRRIEAAIEGAREMRAWTGPATNPDDEVSETGGTGGEIDLAQRIKEQTSIRPKKPLPKP